MSRKYFDFDKNYLLKDAQEASRECLLTSLVQTVKECYEQLYNPLGLVDDTIVMIRQSEACNIDYFTEFYDDLAGIYRYKYGEVQLEFLWDGTSHFEKYRNEWEKTFFKWLRAFCQNQAFIRAVFELTVFYSDLTRPELIQNRLRSFLVSYFELKIYHYRGIVGNQAVA